MAGNNLAEVVVAVEDNNLAEVVDNKAVAVEEVENDQVEERITLVVEDEVDMTYLFRCKKRREEERKREKRFTFRFIFYASNVGMCGWMMRGK